MQGDMLKLIGGSVVMAAICGGCYWNRAAFDPYRFAPASASKAWTPPAAAAQKRTDMPTALPDQILPLTLAELVDIALRNNTQTRQTWAQARQSAANYGQTQSPAFPTIGATWTYEHFRSATFTTGASGFQPNATSASGGQTAGSGSFVTASPTLQSFFLSQWGPQLSLSYTILDFGQQRLTSEAARQALYFADWTHNRALQTVIQTITIDYYNYLYQKQLLDSYLADLETAQTTLDAATLNLKRGVKDISDLLQARTQFLQKKTQWTSQQKAVQNTFAALLTDMGLPANQSFEVEPLPEVDPKQKIMEDVDELIAAALQVRPDFLAAKADLHAKTNTLEAAKRSYWPTIQYQFNIGTTTYSGGINDGYDFDGTVTFSFPLFNGGYYRNGVRIAKAAREFSKASLKQKELSVIEDITTAHYNIRVAFDTLKYANDFLKAAKEQYDVAISKYRVGTNTILDVVSAQSSLANARANQASALQQWFTSLANLAYATGTLTEAINPMEMR